MSGVVAGPRHRGVHGFRARLRRPGMTNTAGTRCVICPEPRQPLLPAAASAYGRRLPGPSAMLDLTALLVFAGALFVAAASPGPGIAAIVARVLGRGADGAVAFTMGVGVGDVVWLTFAVAGLAVLAQTFGLVFTLIKFAGAAYLLFLAWKLWTAPVAIVDPAAAAPQRQRPWRAFLGGLAVTL